MDLLDSDEIISSELLAYKVAEIPNPKHQFLVAIEYLTGGRVGELLKKIKTKNIEVKLIEGNEWLFVKNVRTEKNAMHPLRNIPIPIYKEKEFLHFITNYVQDKQPEEILLPFSKVTAWKVVSKFVSSFKKKSKDNIFLNANHYFRHVRTTHLVEKYNFSDQDLKQWHGWSNTVPASKYSHLSTQSLINKLSKN